MFKTIDSVLTRPSSICYFSIWFSNIWCH